MNATLKENKEQDLTIMLTSSTHCVNNIQNITGSGDREIKYVSETTIIENKTLSGLVLCNADGSTFTNITIIGSDSLGNNGIFGVFFTGS